MRNTEISLVFVVVILLALLIPAVALGSAGGWFWVAVVAFIAFVRVTSYYFVDSDKMLQSRFTGSPSTVYTSVSFLSATKGADTMNGLGAESGLFGTGYVVLLWPFWDGTYLPTTEITLNGHVATVYTKELPDHPSVPVQVDFAIQLRLSVAIARFVETFNVLGQAKDMAMEVVLHDDLWSPDQADPSAHTYRTARLAQIIQRPIMMNAEYAVRAVMGSSHSWGGPSSGAVTDIRAALPAFSEAVQVAMARQENTMVRQGDVLHADGGPGPAVMSFIVIAKDVSLQDTDAAAALSRPLVERLEADAQRLKGVGEGDRIKEKARQAGVTPGEIWQGEVVQETQPKVFTLGDKASDMLKKLFGGP